MWLNPSKKNKEGLPPGLARLLTQMGLYSRGNGSNDAKGNAIYMSTTDSTQTNNRTMSSRFDETARTIIGAALIAVVIRTFIIEPFNIPSSSMVPGLLIGDFLFVSKYTYGYSSRSTVFGLLPFQGRLFEGEPKRGDVVVFKWPQDNRTDYIKRVVGLPGDTVQMRHGMLYINGVMASRRKLAEPLAEKYVEPPPETADYVEAFPGDGKTHVIRKEGDDFPLDDTEVFTVPPRHYFMMGDNRNNSQDSRTPNVAYVPEDNLVGRAEFIFFSLDEKARFWEFWKWPWSVRWDRLFMKID